MDKLPAAVDPHQPISAPPAEAQTLAGHGQGAGPQHTHCTNCGTALQGPYCHLCGQATKDVLRHLPGLVADAADLAFNLDGRIMRTVPTLYFHPGRLTLDYFAGKRVSYISPFRLVFLLAIIAFFSFQVSLQASFNQQGTLAVSVPGGMHVSVTQSPAAASSTGTPAPVTKDSRQEKPWLGNLSKPVDMAWLPAFANAWLTQSLNHARDHLDILRHGSAEQKKADLRSIALGMFAVAPTVLFVLLPVFALLLQVFYLFKRRLYIEHLIVAMHSHAFLLLSTLVLLLNGLLGAWLVPHASWLAVPFGLVSAAIWIWMVVYLFLMQKHVYQQGWVMTTLKFGCIGFGYGLLLTFALTAASLLSLAR